MSVSTLDSGLKLHQTSLLQHAAHVTFIKWCFLLINCVAHNCKEIYNTRSNLAKYRSRAFPFARVKLFKNNCAKTKNCHCLLKLSWSPFDHIFMNSFPCRHCILPKEIKNKYLITAKDISLWYRVEQRVGNLSCGSRYHNPQRFCLKRNKQKTMTRYFCWFSYSLDSTQNQWLKQYYLFRSKYVWLLSIHIDYTLTTQPNRFQRHAFLEINLRIRLWTKLRNVFMKLHFQFHSCLSKHPYTISAYSHVNVHVYATFCTIL